MADQTIQVTIPEAALSETQTEQVATAADTVVLAAQTAVALAEGQAALANQQAAEVATEAAEAAQEAVAVVRSAEETITWLAETVANQQQTISDLILRTSDLEARTVTTPEAIALETTEIQPDGTTTDLTLVSTSPETNATLTEAIEESDAREEAAAESQEPAPPEPARRVRHLL